MLSKLIRKKIDADRLANIFVNSIFEITDSGFDDLKEMISEDPAFVYLPNIDSKHSDRFLLIITVGNLDVLHDYFEVEEANEIRRLIIQKFATIYNMGDTEFEELIQKTKRFVSEVNFPSKNMLYGMSKAIFHKFELNDYQEDYFRSMKSPNPLFLKRMDELMENFLWDWDKFFKKHKLHLN